MSIVEVIIMGMQSIRRTDESSFGKCVMRMMRMMRQERNVEFILRVGGVISFSSKLATQGRIHVCLSTYVCSWIHMSAFQIQKSAWMLSYRYRTLSDLHLFYYFSGCPSKQKILLGDDLQWFFWPFCRTWPGHAECCGKYFVCGLWACQLHPAFPVDLLHLWDFYPPACICADRLHSCKGKYSLHDF